eukprot:snap_masked-scaffold_8-processed-gene-0.20-mRNA-1 protein AED:1.00 eAED:1.00 QI:0/0/0/0/1/1/2/0/390
MQTLSKEEKPFYYTHNLYLGYCAWPISAKCNQKKYCDNHYTPDKSEEATKVPCPLDPTHSIETYRLKKHLQICNVAKHIQSQKDHPYYSENINSFSFTRNKVKKDLSKLSKHKFDQILYKINIFLIQRPLKKSSITLDVKQLEIPKQKKTFLKFKHTQQVKSLVKVLSQFIDTNKPSYVVELGAAKGLFSVGLRPHLAENSHFLLIDRAAFKTRFDREESQKSNWERIRLDIKDLDISKSEGFHRFKGTSVAMSKHLCGVATDYGLKLAMRSKFDVICIALCCHQLCEWEWEDEEIGGITKEDFGYVKLMCSWAVCHGEKGKKEELLRGGSWREEMSIKEKEQVGWLCKRFIDEIRRSYLEKEGYKVDFLEYIGKEITLENRVLVAIREF